MISAMLGCPRPRRSGKVAGAPEESDRGDRSSRDASPEHEIPEVERAKAPVAPWRTTSAPLAARPIAVRVATAGLEARNHPAAAPRGTPRPATIVAARPPMRIRRVSTAVAWSRMAASSDAGERPSSAAMDRRSLLVVVGARASICRLLRSMEELGQRRPSGAMRWPSESAGDGDAGHPSAVASRGREVAAPPIASTAYRPSRAITPKFQLKQEVP